jgi:rubrerythrin
MGVDTSLAIIQQAIEIEQFGYNFYNNMRSFVHNRVGQKVISHLVNMEVDHIKWLEEEYDRQLDRLEVLDDTEHIDVSIEGKSEMFVVDRLPEVFRGSGPEEALEYAIEVEKKSMAYYANNMKITDDDNIRQLFHRLADFEKEHIELLDRNLQSLRSGGPWIFQTEV